jgi:hypothetical protein
VAKKRRKSPQDRLRAYQDEYDRLKPAILDIGFICTGSLNERWLTCGNPNCRCHKDPSQRHGPYYQLSWKEKGKTISRFLSPQIALLYREWIDNRRRLDQIIAKMHTISENAQKCILPPEARKTTPSRTPKSHRRRRLRKRS